MINESKEMERDEEIKKEFLYWMNQMINKIDKNTKLSCNIWTIPIALVVSMYSL